MATPAQVNIALGILNQYQENEPESETCRGMVLAAGNLIRNVINGHETIAAPRAAPEGLAPGSVAEVKPSTIAAFFGQRLAAVDADPMKPVAGPDGSDDTQDEYTVVGLSSGEMREVCKLLNTMRSQPPPAVS